MSEELCSVKNFREYLKIKTVQPKPDYGGAIKFLETLAVELELNFQVIQITESHPMLLMTWVGSNPTLPTILLSSHMDVVPVFEEHWKVDPFSGYKDENGDIYGRGTQDMKSVGIQYLEAIRKLKDSGFAPKRTIHVLFTTDEEIGSYNGIEQFVHQDQFHNLHVGCMLDEGLANPSEEYIIYTGQKVNYSFRVKCRGNPGHGSQLIENTAGEKMRAVINQMMDLRETEKSKLKDGITQLKDIIVVNFTIMEGGKLINVVPAELTACFDMRVPPHYEREDVDAMLNGFFSDESITWSYTYNPKSVPESSVDESDPWWSAISSAMTTCNAKYKVDIFPAATDSRFVRPLGIPTYGFSPMNHTPVLLHDHNERLNEAVFLRGINIYVTLISNLAAVPA